MDMTIATIQQVAESQTQNNTNLEQASDLTTENTASGQDVANFNNILKHAGMERPEAAAVEASSGNHSGPLGYVGDKVLGMVDSIHTSRDKVNELMSNYPKIGVKGLLELQANLVNFNDTTQILSKVVSTVSKQVDALVHIQ